MSEPADPAPPATPTRRSPAGPIALLVVGVLLVLTAGAAAVGGATLTWAYATQRDDDGWFSTGDERFDTGTAAIVSDEIDLGVVPGRERVDLGDLATVRIEVESAAEGAVFVGIGPQDEVDVYLQGVARAEIAHVELDPFSVEYDVVDGADTAPPPGDQGFWVAQGSGTEPLVWELESGNWVVVVMNADGSAGVNVDASVAAKADWFLPVALALLFGGALVLAGGVVLGILGIRGLSRHPSTPVPTSSAALDGVPPVRLRGRRDEPLSRWLWLVKWVLLIPHLFLLVFLWLGVVVVTVIAWFAILFTGEYPRPLFAYTTGVLRWHWRVSYYGYGALGTDRYPPFSFEAEPDYPAGLDIDRPERLSRGLIFVKSWFLALPHLLIVGVIAGWGTGRGLLGEDWGVTGGPGLLDLLVLVAAGCLLFLAGYPRGLFDLVVGLNRWIFRVLAYVLLLRDEYPPFRLDQGEDEPLTTTPAAAQEARGQEP
jgi:hypothetical protein